MLFRQSSLLACLHRKDGSAAPRVTQLCYSSEVGLSPSVFAPDARTDVTTGSAPLAMSAGWNAATGSAYALLGALPA